MWRLVAVTSTGARMPSLAHRIVRLIAGWLLAALVPLAAQGEEWLPLGQISHIHGIAVDRRDSSQFHLATHHGLYLGRADGRVRLVSPLRHDLMGFSAHPREDDTFLASGHPAGGGNLGVVRSRDGGQTWETIAAGVGGPVDFHQMDISKSDPKIVYGVYRGLQVSEDSGRTWRMVGPAPERLIDLAVGGGDPARLYAATERGLLESSDGGRSWTAALPSPRPVTMVETTAAGEEFAYVIGVGLLKRDQGGAWQRLGGLADGEFMLHFAAAHDRYYAVTQKSSVVMSRDGGATWQRLEP